MDIAKSVGSAIAGEDSLVYIEALPQGFKSPCFFVRELKRSCVRTVGERFRQKSEIEIRYYPKDRLAAREECSTVSDSLFEGLEFVQTDEGLLHGVEKRSEIKDGVLSFYVSFEFFTLVEKKVEKMGRLDINGSPVRMN